MISHRHSIQLLEITDVFWESLSKHRPTPLQMFPGTDLGCQVDNPRNQNASVQCGYLRILVRMPYLRKMGHYTAVAKMWESSLALASKSCPRVLLHWYRADVDENRHLRVSHRHILLARLHNDSPSASHIRLRAKLRWCKFGASSFCG